MIYSFVVVPPLYLLVLLSTNAEGEHRGSADEGGEGAGGGVGGRLAGQGRCLPVQSKPGLPHVLLHVVLHVVLPEAGVKPDWV